MRTFAAIHLHSASWSPCQGRRTVQLRGYFLQCHDRGSNHASWNTNTAPWGEPTSSMWWQFLAGIALESEVSRKIFRVTLRVVPQVMLTSKQSCVVALGEYAGTQPLLWCQVNNVMGRPVFTSKLLVILIIFQLFRGPCNIGRQRPLQQTDCVLKLDREILWVHGEKTFLGLGQQC